MTKIRTTSARFFHAHIGWLLFKLWPDRRSISSRLQKDPLVMCNIDILLLGVLVVLFCRLCSARSGTAGSARRWFSHRRRAKVVALQHGTF